MKKRYLYREKEIAYITDLYYKGVKHSVITEKVNKRFKRKTPRTQFAISKMISRYIVW